MKSEEPGVITAQLDLIELNLRVAALQIKEAQSFALFKPCTLGPLDPCLLCKTKRWLLRRRYT